MKKIDRTERTPLEDLSAELFIEIFDYFTANEIYFSFSHLNIRFSDHYLTYCSLQRNTPIRRYSLVNTPI